MNHYRQPELAPRRAARVVCALAATTVTWALFSGVVSLADEPPMAMAGQRSGEAFARAASEAKLAQAQPAQTVTAAR